MVDGVRGAEKPEGEDDDGGEGAHDQDGCGTAVLVGEEIGNAAAEDARPIEDGNEVVARFGETP